MLTDDVRILFSGFEPTADVKSKLDLLLGQVQMLSPSKSFMSATFTLTNGLFEGVLNVSSNVGDFVVRATDQQPAELARTLRDGLVSQLDRWKSRRFNP